MHGSWEDSLPDGPFDRILLASALHYAKDPRALLEDLRARLAPGGVLILEAGVSPEHHSAMVTVVREGDIRPFPTMIYLRTVLLDGFAVRRVGASVRQAGDPVPRSVFHCTRRQPVALVVSGASGVGKSSLGLLLQRDHRVIETDVILGQLRRNGLLAEWPHVEDLVSGASVGGLNAVYAEVREQPESAGRRARRAHHHRSGPGRAGRLHRPGAARGPGRAQRWRGRATSSGPARPTPLRR